MAADYGVKYVSRYYNCVRTLRAVADQHKKDCDQPNCDVSLTALMDIALDYLALAPTTERPEIIEKYLKGWPI